MTAKDFGDVTAATRMRDAVTQMVRSVLKTERPSDSYATVQSVNRSARTAVVRFPGETQDITLPMSMNQPSAAGQVVRVKGGATDRYIDAPAGAGAVSFLYAQSGTITNTLTVSGDFAGVAARLSRTNAPTLGGIFHGLEIGTAGNTAGQIGLMFGPAAMQAKNGSSASVLDINSAGGTVKINAVDVSVALAQWTTYAPTIVQSVTVTHTVTYARYVKLGRWVYVQVYLAITGAGTATHAIRVSLPFTAVQNTLPCGSFYLYDSPSVNRMGQTVLYSTTEMGGMLDNNAGYVGNSVWTNALASGDSLLMSCLYEATT